MKDKIKIFIVEDHHLVAKLLSVNLGVIDDFNIVGVSYDGEDAIELIRKLVPDVVLLDIDMPVIDGMQVLKEIHTSNPEIKVIMVSNHTESWLIKKSLLSGAMGYITKFAESDELIESVHSVMNNKKYLCHLSQRNVNLNDISSSDRNEIDEAEIENESISTKYLRLTKREKQVFKLIVKGYSTKEIAGELYISERTVETHRKHLLKKIDVKNTAEMIRQSIECGMFQDED